MNFTNENDYQRRVILNGHDELAFGNLHQVRTQTPPTPAANTARLQQQQQQQQHQQQHDRHPEYRDKHTRIRTYSRWAYSHVQDPTRLSNNGFFYTNEGDLVRCFSCSLGLKDFIQSDDPLLEHVRYSGEKCAFLLQLVGPTRLSQIKRSIATGAPIPPIGNLNQEQQSTGETLTGHSQTQQTHNPTPSPDAQKVVPTKHRSPNYRSYTVRLASFDNWPKYLAQTPQKLAEAGFYYTGVRDVVRCWSCDGGLQKWDPTDDPLMEHCVHFSHCYFLKELKGESYIALAQSHYNSTKFTNAQSKPVTQTPVSPNDVSKQLTKLDIREEPVKTKTTDKPSVVTMCSEMGYQLSEIELAVRTLRNGNLDISVDAVVEQIENSRSVHDIETKPQSRQEVIAEHERLRSQLYCLKCTTADINSLFLPCQHHRFCTGCAEDLTSCPLCGRRIDHKIKTYRP